jgi:hypothetical protein
MDDIVNKADGKVQVIFEKTGDRGSFRDALWFSDEEYENTTSDQILSLQQQRYENWLAVINAMPTEELIPETPPTE